MNSDSIIPILGTNSNFSYPQDSIVPQPEENPILPDTEVNSVLLYLKSNPPPDDGESQPESVDLDSIGEKSPVNLVNSNIQVRFKAEGKRLSLILPPQSQVPSTPSSWSEIWQQIKLRLNGGDRLQSPNTPVDLIAGDRLLDNRQLQQLAQILDEAQLQLKSVATSRRQTAIAAATAGYSVEQIQQEDPLFAKSKPTSAPLAEALYLQMTVRSGVEIRHPGTVIVLGDVNPGGIVIADGDILVWGRLRGIAHAGAGGNQECLIMALQMEPTQLRIADAVARAPEKSPMQLYPEVAYITPEGIRITKASDFSRPQVNKIDANDP
ncbi:MAG: septum site-determining protein MinC [Nostocaceae cyanobacterium]|nr:septum site-determining protein MinC [Nostocaceae cyanobacterium]